MNYRPTTFLVILASTFVSTGAIAQLGRGQMRGPTQPAQNMNFQKPGKPKDYTTQEPSINQGGKIINGLGNAQQGQQAGARTPGLALLGLQPIGLSPIGLGELSLPPLNLAVFSDPRVMGSQQPNPNEQFRPGVAPEVAPVLQDIGIGNTILPAERVIVPGGVPGSVIPGGLFSPMPPKSDIDKPVLDRLRDRSETNAVPQTNNPKP